MWVIIITKDRVDIKLNGLVFVKHLAQTWYIGVLHTHLFNYVNKC